MIDKVEMIVGLGNPGKDYAQTYHNVGQQFISFLSGEKKRFKSQPLFSVAKLDLASNRKILLIQPKTFMNNSGRAIRAALKYFHLSPAALLVAHDEFDIPIGEFRISKNRGSAGHHGVDSIIQHLHTKDFYRVRIGISHPNHKAEAVVLRSLSSKDRKIFQGVFSVIREKVIENP